VNPAPDIRLSTGRTVRHTPELNGSQRATPTPGMNAMTPEEWLEYCSVVRQEAPPFPEHARPRLQAAVTKLRTAAALRAGDTEFLRKP
jgi:hypothetical protein